MANLIETVDFNSTGAFDSKDLDISWAYIQAKKLYEIEQAEIQAGTLSSSAATITTDNFIDKVNEMYANNKTSGIAESTTDVPTKLPGTLSVGVPNPTKRLNFKKLWLFNNPHSPQNVVLDSVSGLSKGQLINALYTSTDKNIDTVNMYLSANGGQVLLEDDGDLRSDRNWTFYVKGNLRRPPNGSELFKKGSFGLFTWETSQVATGLGLRLSSSGKYFGGDATSVHNYFSTPYSIHDIKNKQMELSLVREGLSIRVYINGQECIKLSGDQPDPIVGADKTEPIKLPTSAWSKLDVCYISELDFVNNDVLNDAKVYTGDELSFSFAHDMDIANSFYASKQFFPDRFGSFARIWNTPWGPADYAQIQWVEPPSTFDTSNGYVAKTKCLRMSSHRNNEYMTLPNVDFSKNFTISFWFAGGSTTNILEMTGSDGTKIYLKSHYAYTDTLSMRIYFGNQETIYDVEGFAPGPATKWQHITLVKNGNFFSLFGNGKHSANTWLPRFLDDSTQQSMGSTSVQFNGVLKGVHLYLSHIRVLPYAICEIPFKSVGRKSNYGIFPRLIEPIDPGRLS